MAEQDLYRREGLPWHGLELPDSSPVVSAIGHTFRILDEYSQQLAKGLDLWVEIDFVFEGFIHSDFADHVQCLLANAGFAQVTLAY